MNAYIRLIRVPQWLKNIFVFAALVFGRKLLDPHAIELSLLAFGCFCLASSAGYIFNDILDRDRDRLHPKKRNRPLASGQVSVASAAVLMTLLLAGALGGGMLLPVAFRWTLLGYLFLTVAYSLFLKHRMILDVIVIAMLFVMRALGGAFAIDVPYSEWLLVCTFMLCLFLGFGKRRCEIAMIANAEDSKQHRRTLDRYTPDLLTHLLSTSGGVAIVTFLLYTLDNSIPSEFGEQKQNLIYTLPLVAYGIYRYAMLIEQGSATGPTDLIIKDPPFVMAIVLWAIIAGLILYVGTDEPVVPPDSPVSVRSAEPDAPPGEPDLDGANSARDSVVQWKEAVRPFADWHIVDRHAPSARICWGGHERQRVA